VAARPLTPADLARAANRSSARIYGLLRELYPERAPGVGGRWLLTEEMIAAVMARLHGAAPRRLSAVIADDAEVEPVAGDSAEQRAAEEAMLQLLGRELGVTLKKRRLTADGGAWIEVDGFSDQPPVLVEAWAHQGPLKPAQKAKVITDVLRLAWAEATFLPGAKKILLFSDEEAAGRFRPGRNTWSGAAVAHFGVEIRVVTLPDQMRAAVRHAQRRQSR
jgi:hypothetical protein